MEAKIVVGTKDGKSYNLEAKEDTAAVFVGKRIGDTVNVTPLGLKGYEVKITGGSDKQGFPMRKDLHKPGRGKAMMSTRTQGYRPEQEGVRVRKTVVGDIIGDNISQINTVVVKAGKDPIPKLLGLGKKEGEGEAEEKPKEEAKPEAPKEEKKEEKPAEAPKEEKEEPKEEGSKKAPAEKKETPAEEKKESSGKEPK